MSREFLLPAPPTGSNTWTACEKYACYIGASAAIRSRQRGSAGARCATSGMSWMNRVAGPRPTLLT